MKSPTPVRRLFGILAALAAALVCSSASAASLFLGVEASVTNCGSNDQSSSAEYRSWEGLQVYQVGANGSVAGFPNPAAGHLSYRLVGIGVAPNGDFATCMRRDEATGIVEADAAQGAIKLYAASQGTLIIGASRAQYRDLLTFTNNTGTPQQMTVEYHFGGNLSVSGIPQGSGMEHGHAGADARLEFHNSNFYASVSKKNDGDPAFNYANFSSDGWDAGTVQITPQPGANGATFRAGFTVPPGVHQYGIYEPISVFARTGPAAAHFQNTAALKIMVPPGVSFTSESGNFLTGITAFSRKTHGSAGTFDIPLPLSGAPGVECRDSAGTHQIIVKFANPLSTIGAVEVSSGPGNVESANVSGDELVINVAGLVNGQTTTIMLNDANNGAVNGDIAVPIRVLVGDSNGNGVVNATDIAQVKSQAGAPVTLANFRQDVAPNGAITASDVGLVKSRSGATFDEGTR